MLGTAENWDVSEKFIISNCLLSGKAEKNAYKKLINNDRQSEERKQLVSTQGAQRMERSYVDFT